MVLVYLVVRLSDGWARLAVGEEVVTCTGETLAALEEFATWPEAEARARQRRTWLAKDMGKDGWIRNGQGLRWVIELMRRARA